jgi:cation:H+ antiporter
MHLTQWIEQAGLAAPWIFTALFLAGSFLMIWRLEAMAKDGMGGTVLGTLIMPYCTGMANLIFVFVMGRRGGPSTEVLTNCLVNNVTNLTLLIGLPAALWGLTVISNPSAKNKREEKPDASRHADRLSMLLTLLAVLLFTGVAWVLGRQGEIGFGGGLILTGLFLCWQSYHVIAVLKSNRRQNKTFGTMLPVDLLLLAAGTYAVYVSTDGLVAWVSNIKTGLVSAKYLGWLSGWMDVLPNGLLAFYYGWRRKPEVVYTSQVGDGHICIPLCIGIFALYKPIAVPPFFTTGVIILGAATLVHLLFIGRWGRLPRSVGWLLTAAYGLFLYYGLGGSSR